MSKIPQRDIESQPLPHNLDAERIKRGSSGFVKLRRGLREHLGNFPAQALKLWVFLLLNAGWKGSNTALCYFNREEASEVLDLEKRQASYWLAWLCRHDYVEMVKHGNQHGAGVVRILKFDDTTDASAEKQHKQKELVRELVRKPMRKNDTSEAVTLSTRESYVPLRSEEVEEVTQNMKKKAASPPARPSALQKEQIPPSRSPQRGKALMLPKTKHEAVVSNLNQEEPVEKKPENLPVEEKPKALDLAALASNGASFYGPPTITEQEQEQRRQKVKLDLEVHLKLNPHLAKKKPLTKEPEIISLEEARELCIAW